MKATTVFASILVGVVGLFAARGIAAETIDSMPPVVVKTVPESGSMEVAPGAAEIRVTFSKEMTDNSWSWCEPWKGANPVMLGKPTYDTDGKTCVLKVQLEPGKTYAYWLNTEKFQNFKDRAGHPAVPYLLVFQTTAASAPATAPAATAPAAAAAESWLQDLDAAKYEQSWDTLAPLAQSAVTKATWAKSLQTARTPLGKLVARKLKSAQYLTTLPGAPDGQYVVLQYETEFENKKAAIETVTPMKTPDGAWKVSGYYIK